MKAKEYAENYRHDLESEGEETALRNLLIALLHSVYDLCEKRGGEPGLPNTQAFKGAWNEVNAQWKSIAYNNPEFGLKPDGFENWCRIKGMLPK